VVKLVGGLINEIKTQQWVALTEIVRHGNPPVDSLFLVIGFWVVFIFISLISDYRDHAILLAGFYQLAQVDQPRFRRLIGHADAHVGNAFCTKIPYHQRVEFAYAALGTRPVHIHPDAQLLRIMGSRQRRLSGNRPAGRDQQRSGNKRL